jgi:hypothetical protein
MSNMHELPGSPSDDGDLRAAIQALNERLASLEDQFQGEGAPSPSIEFTDEKLATIATSIYRARRRRTKFFSGLLFSEPAWDMLLELFVSKVRVRRISTSSLCLAAYTPLATGLRWIDLLEKEGLVFRHSPNDDGRVTLVEMSPHGFSLMREYVLDGVTKFEMPIPD